jgi:Ni/Fe-hydrogenase subunit HybB-like protein
MYPFMTGLVAGAFVLSSLYHVFGIKQLKDMARFSLVFSFALLMVAPLPLIFHLQQPTRALNVFLTPHFTSAIAAFGIVFSVYGALVAAEIWFVFREHLARTALALKNKQRRGLEHFSFPLYALLTLGAFDLSDQAREADEKAAKVLASIGIPLACFLHGYAGFIFGSVKANALWMTPLMPVIFIMSAVVSGIALCMLTYIVMLEARKLGERMAARRNQTRPRAVTNGAEPAAIHLTTRYLLLFLVFAISLELLDLVFRGYTAVKAWDALRTVIYDRDFVNIFVLQYGLGNLLPFVLLLLPKLTIRRTALCLLLVLFGVFMMRWNVVIGGQAFSLTFYGFMHYHIPVIPHDLETFKEGVGGALVVAILPFFLFWGLSKIFPVGRIEPIHELAEERAPAAPAGIRPIAVSGQ